MNEKRVYLDTSSIVKRYIEQRSSEVIDRVYEESEAGRMKTVFSVWNIGEALDVLAVDLVLAGAIFDACANHNQGRTYNTSTILQREKLQLQALFLCSSELTIIVLFSVIPISLDLMQEFDIRPYQPGDEEGIVELLHLVFDGWPHFDLTCSPVDHWRWKYRDNPLNMMIIGLATHNGKIIGCRHDLIQTLKIGKDLFLSTNGVDIAVHKDFRRIGLSSKMRAHDVEIEKAKGIKLHYGIDGNPILIKKAKRNNYTFPFSLEGMVRIRDVDLHLKMSPTENAFLKKYGYYAMRSINKLTTLGENIDEPQENIKILEIQKFDERIQPFLNEIKQHFEFMVARDTVYLNWRYCDPRGGKYLIKIAAVQDQILGYIVLRINKLRKEYPVGYIVDLLVLPDHLNVANELVKDGVNYFDQENINIIIVHILKNSLFEPILQKIGFVNYKSRAYLNYNPEYKNSAIDELKKSDIKTKHFVMGDFDWI